VALKETTLRPSVQSEGKRTALGPAQADEEFNEGNADFVCNVEREGPKFVGTGLARYLTYYLIRVF
jgi:hypothetical protein